MNVFRSWSWVTVTCSNTLLELKCVNVCVLWDWRLSLHCNCKVNSLPLLFFFLLNKLFLFGCNLSQMTAHKGSCFILPATICKWLRGWTRDLRWLLNDLDSAAIYFPPHHVGSLHRAARSEKITNAFQNLTRLRGCWVEGSLPEEGGCQKSQLAGSALRNLVQQRPISSSDSAQLWLGAHRWGSWMTEIVW